MPWGSKGTFIPLEQSSQSSVEDRWKTNPVWTCRQWRGQDKDPRGQGNIWEAFEIFGFQETCQATFTGSVSKFDSLLNQREQRPFTRSLTKLSIKAEKTGLTTADPNLLKPVSRSRSKSMLDKTTKRKVSLTFHLFIPCVICSTQSKTQSRTQELRTKNFELEIVIPVLVSREVDLIHLLLPILWPAEQFFTPNSKIQFM